MADWARSNVGAHVVETETRDPRRTPDNDFIYVDVSSVDNARFVIESPQMLKGACAPSRARKVIRAGDVICATVRPTLRRVALVTRRYDNQICSTGFCVLRTDGSVDPAFLYYSLLTDDVTRYMESIQRGASYPAIRDSDVKKLRLMVPEHNEQCRIAALLSAVQRAIEQQERLIALTTELKKALMQKLFTEGTRGEAQKETDIGLVPESWDIVPLSELLAKPLQNGAFIKRPVEGEGLLFANVVHMYQGLYLGTSRLTRLRVSSDNVSQYMLSKGDVLVVRSSLKRDGIGQSTVVGEMPEQAFFDCHIIRIRPNPSALLPEYLASYWRSPMGEQDLVGRSKTTTMTTLNQRSISGALVPIPSIAEQREIVEYLIKTEAAEQKRKAYSTTLALLFRTLLHQLMTAQLRVDQVDMSELKALGIEVN